MTTTTTAAVRAPRPHASTPLRHRHRLWVVAAVLYLVVLLLALVVITGAGGDREATCDGRQFVAGGVCWTGSVR